jgi:hypothetical protein
MVFYSALKHALMITAFVFMFAIGLVPFSVLAPGSIVQDRQGIPPLLSYSLKDTLPIRVFDVSFGLMIGLALYGLGI